MPGCTVLCVLLILSSLQTPWAATAQPSAVRPDARQEPITPIPLPPAQNPKRLALGEQLFQDPRLSHDNTRSCGACHDIQTNGASAAAHDAKLQGQPLELNTPTVFNAALSFRLNWEGDFRAFERHTEHILENPNIMASSVGEALTKLQEDPEVVRQFREAYGRDPDREAVLDAIASYERSLLTPGCRFDRWLDGDTGALNPEELSGYQLFKSLGCISCHQGVNVGGNLFQRHGIFHPLGSPKPELLRVPSLRNVTTTPPYFHDGSAQTLPEAVKAMGFAQLDRVLNEQQITAIVAFLHTLTGSYRGRPISPAAKTAQEAAPP